jgi:hypothetical protein
MVTSNQNQTKPISPTATMISSRPIGITFEGDYHHLAKTPGNRMMKPRNTLQENVGRHVPVTVDGKAKKAALQQTPFHPNTLRELLFFQDRAACSYTILQNHKRSSRIMMEQLN